ncbi:hypothetical protein [Vibrio parahaemolyticus]|uniref:hypothetical protein n=1 Tax=Vibrio parahaemolyticus TaxID=670 RepID=UPI00389250E4
MSDYDKALELLNSEITLDVMLQWENLCQNARGAEAEHIAELYTSFEAKMSDDVYEDYMAHLAKDE